MKGKLLLLAIIVGAIAFGAYIWFPSLNIPSIIDFDQATLNTKLAFTFNINNNTYSEIQITNYQTGCPCNSLHVKDDMGNLVNLRGTSIKPRTQQTVYAYFTIIPENGQTIYSKPVSISTNLPSIPQLFTVVTVKRVNGIIEAKPDLLTSTNAVADQASYQKITLYNGSDRNYIINHFESPGPVKFECPNLQLPIELSPSRAIELNFKITPLKSGLLEGKLSVYCQDHIISVPYAIRAAGFTYLSDSILFFPSKHANQTSQSVLRAHANLDIEAVSNEQIEGNRVALQWKRINSRIFEAIVTLAEDARQTPFALEIVVAIQTQKGTEKHSLRIRNMPDNNTSGK